MGVISVSRKNLPYLFRLRQECILRCAGSGVEALVVLSS